MQIPIIAQRGQAKPYPSIPRINWDHSLTKGLIFYHYDLGGVRIPDLVTGRPQSLNSANALARRTSAWGTAYLIPDSAADGLTYASDTALRILPPMAFATGFMRTVVGTKANFPIMGRAISNVAAPTFWNWVITDRHNGSAGTIGIYIDSAATITPTVSVAVTTGVYHSIIGSAATTATLNWWVDGLPQTNLTGLTITKDDTTDPILIGTDNAGPGGYQGLVYWGAVWNRSLTQSEARLLNDDPYCFLIYPEDRIFATQIGRRNRFGFTVGRSPLVPVTRMIGY